MKQRRRRKNKIKLFISVLCFVLLLGALVLAGLFYLKENRQETPEAETEPETAQTESSGWEQFQMQGEQGTASEKLTEQETSAGRYGALLADPERMRQENVYSRQAAETDKITLLFAGDILFDDRYSPMIHLKQKGEGIEGVISEEALALMRSADVFMLNNEFPYSTGGAPLEDKQFTFRAAPEYAAYLGDMGVDVVSLANNHAYDYGERALSDTFDTLRKYQIPYVGAGKNISEASGPVYFVVNDCKIGILSATQIERLDNPDTKGATESSAGVFRCWNIELLLQRIAEVKQNCDYLIVYLHWGTENEEKSDWAQQQQAAQIAEAGADLIVGAHPHCLQTIERVKSVPVIYSLGNCWFNSKELDTGLLQVTIRPDSGETQSLRFIPARQQGCETWILEGSEKERVLSHLREISPGITIDQDGFFY